MSVAVAKKTSAWLSDDLELEADPPRSGIVVRRREPYEPDDDGDEYMVVTLDEVELIDPRVELLERSAPSKPACPTTESIASNMGFLIALTALCAALAHVLH